MPHQTREQFSPVQSCHWYRVSLYSILMAFCFSHKRSQNICLIFSKLFTSQAVSDYFLLSRLATSMSLTINQTYLKAPKCSQKNNLTFSLKKAHTRQSFRLLCSSRAKETFPLPHSVPYQFSLVLLKPFLFH